MNKNEKYHPTTLKMEIDWSSWEDWEIPFSLNGLNLPSWTKISISICKRRAVLSEIAVQRWGKALKRHTKHTM